MKKETMRAKNEVTEVRGDTMILTAGVGVWRTNATSTTVGVDLVNEPPTSMTNHVTVNLANHSAMAGQATRWRLIEKGGDDRPGNIMVQLAPVCVAATS